MDGHFGENPPHWLTSKIIPIRKTIFLLPKSVVNYLKIKLPDFSFNSTIFGVTLVYLLIPSNQHHHDQSTVSAKATTENFASANSVA